MIENNDNKMMFSRTSKQPTINWELIWRAVHYYKRLGYRYTEVPWLVSNEAIAATLPRDKEPFQTVHGCLVGSAEQSFIHMMMSGELVPGRYCACSPCFRDDALDDIHQLHFMKVELIHFERGNIDDHDASVAEVCQAADSFFRSLGAYKTKLVQIADSFDIEINGIEVGSYGYRTFNEFSWVYGTGIAEPRFSIANNWGSA